MKKYAVCLTPPPLFFHLGMDEETAVHQRNHENMVVRQGELWWHDFYYLVDLVEKQNVRPWIWSDYAWDHPDLFFEKKCQNLFCKVTGIMDHNLKISATL